MEWSIRLPVLHCLPEFAQTHVHWVSDAFQPSYPLWPPSPPAFSLSQHQNLFQWAGSLHQPAKGRFIFSISPSNEYSGLIFFRTDRFDLLAVQGTFQSLLQHHNWKASILWHSAFFMVQLPHPFTRKMILSGWHTMLWLRPMSVAYLTSQTVFQPLVFTRVTGRTWQSEDLGLIPSFWFNRSGRGAENLHFLQVQKWFWFWCNRDHTWIPLSWSWSWKPLL